MEVANLGGLRTPLEKLISMKQTLDIITECVNSHLSSFRSLSEGMFDGEMLFLFENPRV